MTKEAIEKAISQMPNYVPVRIIERKLGMPKTTLQKVLKGQRELPKKWAKPLDDYFLRSRVGFYVPKGMGEGKDVEKVKVTWNPPHTQSSPSDIQAQIDKLTEEMNGIKEGNFGTPLRNKLLDKITKLKRQL